MGLLDNIKNYVTGVAAEVTLELTPQQVNRGQNINFKVTVKAQEDLLIKTVLISLKAEEFTTTTALLYAHEIALDHNIQLRKGDIKSWESSFQIPIDAAKSWKGKHSTMHWFALGKIEIPGLNPDSPWKKFYVL